MLLGSLRTFVISSLQGHVNPLSDITDDEPAADYEATAKDKHGDNKNKVGRTASSHHSDTSKADQNKQQSYDDACEQVVSVWPDFRPLKAVGVGSFSKEVLRAIKQVYEKLIEQHSNIGRLSEEKNEALQSRKELLLQNDDHLQLLRKRDAEIMQLRDDVEFCRRELRKYAAESDRTSRYSESTAGQGSLERVRRPGSGFRGSEYKPDLSPRDKIHEEDVSLYEETDLPLDRLKKKEKHGILQATPLLTAEGMEGSKVALLRRPSALRPVARNSPVAMVEPLYENGASPGKVSGVTREEDLVAQVKRLEAELARERTEKHAFQSRWGRRLHGVSETCKVLESTNLTSS